MRVSMHQSHIPLVTKTKTNPKAEKAKLKMPVKMDTKMRLGQYDPWVITKTLEVKDEYNIIRLPTKETQVEIIERWSNRLAINNPVLVKLYDWDTDKIYDVSVHQDARGYFLNLGWVLVLFDRQLKEGDRVGFFWDNLDSILNFKVLQKKVA